MKTMKWKMDNNKTDFNILGLQLTFVDLEVCSHGSWLMNCGPLTYPSVPALTSDPSRTGHNQPTRLLFGHTWIDREKKDRLISVLVLSGYPKVSVPSWYWQIVICFFFINLLASTPIKTVVCWKGRSNTRVEKKIIHIKSNQATSH